MSTNEKQKALEKTFKILCVILKLDNIKFVQTQRYINMVKYCIDPPY